MVAGCSDLLYLASENGGFLKWKYPKSSFYRWDFPSKNHPAIGVPLISGQRRVAPAISTPSSLLNLESSSVAYRGVNIDGGEPKTRPFLAQKRGSDEKLWDLLMNLGFRGTISCRFSIFLAISGVDTRASWRCG